jgi:hypothetical protein
MSIGAVCIGGRAQRPAHPELYRVTCAEMPAADILEERFLLPAEIE